jgi:hypothetical protein
MIQTFVCKYKTFDLFKVESLWFKVQGRIKFQPRSVNNEESTAQRKPRSVNNEVSTAQRKPRSVNNEVSTAQRKL